MLEATALFLSATGSLPDRDHTPGERCVPHDEFETSDGLAIRHLKPCKEALTPV